MPDENQHELIQVPLRWNNAENLLVQFANQMVIQHVEHEFVLSFGVATPPIFVGPSAEDQLKDVTEVPVTPIVRIGLTPARLLQLIKILQDNYRGYQATLAQKENQ